MGSPFPKIRRIIAPANGPVLYSALFNLQKTVCQRPQVIPLANWYGTGSGSDLVDSDVVAYKAPGRYRSLYRTILRIRQLYLT